MGGWIVNEVVAKATVHITPDLTGFGEDLKAKLDAAMSNTDKTVGKDASVKLDVEDTEFKRKIEADTLKADVLGSKTETVKIEADVKTATAEEELKKLGERATEGLKNFTALNENLTGTNKTLQGTGESAAGAGEGIGGILMPAILTLGSAITPLAGVTTGFGIALAGVGTAAIGDRDIVVNDDRYRRFGSGAGDRQRQEETAGRFLVLGANLNDVHAAGDQLPGDLAGVASGQERRVNESV